MEKKSKEVKELENKVVLIMHAIAKIRSLLDINLEIHETTQSVLLSLVDAVMGDKKKGKKK